MRPIMTRDEIEQIISESEKTELPWYDDSRTRRDFLSNVIASGDRAKILQVLKQLSLHKIKVEKENHKFYATDEALLTRAIKIITEDFAFALGLEKEQVLPYILKIAKNKRAETRSFIFLQYSLSKPQTPLADRRLPARFRPLHPEGHTKTARGPPGQREHGY